MSNWWVLESVNILTSQPSYIMKGRDTTENIIHAKRFKTKSEAQQYMADHSIPVGWYQTAHVQQWKDVD